VVAPCLFSEILTEYRDVLIRPRFRFSIDDVDALLGLLRNRGTLHDPVPAVRSSPDPDDDKFIACAFESKADFLVTGNKRHFPQSQVEGVKVVNAGELLEYITQEL